MIDFDVLSSNGKVVVKSNEFVTKNGVVLKIQKVRGTIIRELVLKLLEPQVPKTYIEDKERYEENPNDPNYLAELRTYNLLQGNVTTGSYLIFGTSVLSKPDYIFGVDEDWDTDLLEFGIEIRAKGTRSRYLDWLKYYVLEDDKEFLDCVNAIMRYSGAILEEDTVVAENSFPSNEERVSNS